jgi:hypothetical protein
MIALQTLQTFAPSDALKGSADNQGDADQARMASGRVGATTLCRWLSFAQESAPRLLRLVRD